MWELNKNVSTENSRVCDDGCVDDVLYVVVVNFFKLKNYQEVSVT